MSPVRRQRLDELFEEVTPEDVAWAQLGEVPATQQRAQVAVHNHLRQARHLYKSSGSKQDNNYYQYTTTATTTTTTTITTTTRTRPTTTNKQLI